MLLDNELQGFLAKNFKIQVNTVLEAKNILPKMILTESRQNYRNILKVCLKCLENQHAR